MKTLSISILAALLFSINTYATADESTNFVFDEGSVIIHCAQPTTGSDLDDALFLEAFPLWITNLQTHANDGTVARAHYLGELKQGIMVAVLGKDKEDAMKNALAIHLEGVKIMQEAMATTGVEMDSEVLANSCDLIEIGPVAILPMR